MKMEINGYEYNILVNKNKANKNIYIRVTKDLDIQVNTNKYTSNNFILKLINDNSNKIINMINIQKKKNENNEGFNYLGKKYDIVYVDYCNISFGNNKVFLNKNFDIDKWYKIQAKKLFLEHLNVQYSKFSKKIPYPTLKIRKMTSKWGVCNIGTKNITLNLDLIKRDTKYLDYVIVHELSHLVYADHSSNFWKLVEENMYNYKNIREEMKEF